MEDKQRKQPKVYTCTYCNYTAKNNIIFQTHCKTKKHKTFVRQANFTPFCIQNAQSWQPNDTKEKQIYNCELCKFSTTKKYNYDTHILTI